MRKRILTGVFAAAVALALATPVSAANNGNNGNNGNGNGNGNGNAVTAATAQTVYLKGSGSSFSASGWKNTFSVGTLAAGETPNVWHLVYSGKIFADVTSMQVTFTNGEVFEWTADMGPSVNGGGNNMGWVIAAPSGWQIAYVDKGNNNNSDSFLVTREAGNVNFNISGFNKGRPAPPPVGPPAGKLTLDKTVDGQLFAQWAADGDVDVDALLEGMSFSLYAADDEELAVRLAQGTLGADGKITFNLAPGALAPGWYVVVEELSGLAGEVFAEPAPFVIYFNGYSASVVGDTFDPSSDFTVNSGWVVMGPRGVPLRTEFAGNDQVAPFVWNGEKDSPNYPEQYRHQANEVQGISTRTSAGGEYPAFCAHVGSWAYSNNAYAPYTLDETSRAKILSAFNFIVSKYGDGSADTFGLAAEPNAARILAQMAVWYFLPPDSDEFKINSIEVIAVPSWLAGEWTTEGLNAAFAEVVAAGQGYAYVTGPVKGLFYMVGDIDDVGGNQPQIVPLFADGKVNNTTKGELVVSAALMESYTEQTMKLEQQWRTGRYGTSWTTADRPSITGEGCGNNNNQNETYVEIPVSDLVPGAVLGPYQIGSRDNANVPVGGEYFVSVNAAGQVVVTAGDNVVRATEVVAKVFVTKPCWGQEANNGGGVTLVGGGSVVAHNGWDQKTTFNMSSVEGASVFLMVHGSSVTYRTPAGEACVIDTQTTVERGYTGELVAYFTIEGVDGEHALGAPVALAPGTYV
ncbi:MAG: prealbumin-like fold domain-containing protein, partial [Micrococcales bacterium]|nr:prealbumin-like fold domain-containing protein [Micrococcales bacterium]